MPNTSLPSELIQLVQETVEKDYRRLEQYLNRSFERPEITFNQSGKIAGAARLQTNQIRLNPVLLQDNVEVFLNEVIPHEICHLVTYRRYGRVKPHGSEWRSLMQTVFKLPAKSTHSLDVRKVAGAQFKYRCSCGEISLSIRRHNKVQRGQAKYLCKGCGEPLVYVA